MLSRLGRTHPGLIAGILALVLFLAAIALMPGEWRNVFRERAFDIVLAVDRQIRGSNPERNPAVPPVIVVDIDRRSLDSLGSWPWPRETMARLVEAVASGKPSVIAIDVLFAEADTRSPAALARQLGVSYGKSRSQLAGSRSSRWRQASRRGDQERSGNTRICSRRRQRQSRARRAGAGASPGRARWRLAHDGGHRALSASDRCYKRARRAFAAGRRRWKDQARTAPRRRGRCDAAGSRAGSGPAGEAVSGLFTGLRTAKDHRWRPRNAAAGRWSVAIGRRRCPQT